MDNIDSDLLRQCPFDPMHQVRSSRYEIHVSKCKRNYEINNNNKKANIDICPFNFKHQFVGNTLAAFENHKNSCPDRFRLRNEVEIADLVKLEKDTEFKCLLESEPDWHEEAVFIYYFTMNAKSSVIIDPETLINPNYSYGRLSKKERREFNQKLADDFRKKRNENNEKEKMLAQK